MHLTAVRENTQNGSNQHRHQRTPDRARVGRPGAAPGRRVRRADGVRLPDLDQGPRGEGARERPALPRTPPGASARAKPSPEVRADIDAYFGEDSLGLPYSLPAMVLENPEVTDAASLVKLLRSTPTEKLASRLIGGHAEQAQRQDLSGRSSPATATRSTRPASHGTRRTATSCRPSWPTATPSSSGCWASSMRGCPSTRRSSHASRRCSSAT